MPRGRASVTVASWERIAVVTIVINWMHPGSLSAGHSARTWADGPRLPWAVTDLVGG